MENILSRCLFSFLILRIQLLKTELPQPCLQRLPFKRSERGLGL